MKTFFLFLFAQAMAFAGLWLSNQSQFASVPAYEYGAYIMALAYGTLAVAIVCQDEIHKYFGTFLGVFLAGSLLRESPPDFVGVIVRVVAVAYLVVTLIGAFHLNYQIKPRGEEK